jgi:hypothetical protein
VFLTLGQMAAAVVADPAADEPAGVEPAADEPAGVPFDMPGIDPMRLGVVVVVTVAEAASPPLDCGAASVSVVAPSASTAARATAPAPAHHMRAAVPSSPHQVRIRLPNLLMSPPFP